MDKTYEVYLISDSTGETLDRIFLALKVQFLNFKCKHHQYAFTRTENQIIKILETCKKKKKFNNFIYDCRFPVGSASSRKK